LRLDPEAMIERVDGSATRLTQNIPDVTARMAAEGLTHPIIPRFLDELAGRVAECRQILRRKS